MSAFPFLDLPTELQDKVIEYHFGHTFDVRITQHVVGSLYRAEVGHKKVYAAGDFKHLSLLCTSKAIYEQALRALHKSFSGHLNLSSVQYSSKYTMSGMSIPIPLNFPRHLLTSIDLGRIEWREAMLLPTLDGMTNLRIVRFVSSTKGKNSRGFLDACDMSPHDDVVQPFYDGVCDHYFLDIIASRAKRVWRDRAPEINTGVRWYLELIGESCPMVNDCNLTTYCTFTCLDDAVITRRAIVHPKRFLRECEVCMPDCVYFTSRVKFCHECRTPNSPLSRKTLTKAFLDEDERS